MIDLFSNIIGYEDVKKELAEVLNFLNDPKKYTSKGARLPKGLILYGEPGNGKSLFSNSMFEATNRRVYKLSDYLGIDMKQIHMAVKSIFEDARKVDFSIVYIDELDKLFEDTEPNRLQRQQLLVELDGYSSNNNVFVIATANKISKLGDALTRSGRFDRIIKIDLPNIENRKKLLEFKLQNLNTNPDVDMDYLIQITVDCSCADIDNIINEALLLSIRDDCFINKNHFIEATDRVKQKAVRQEQTLDSVSKYRIAVHEIGHAIMVLNSKTIKLDKVTIVPRGNALGHTSYTPYQENFETKQMIMEKLAVGLGGYVAEEIIFGDPSSLAFTDMKLVRLELSYMIDKLGFLGCEYLYSIDRMYLHPSDELNSKREQLEKELLNNILIEVKQTLQHSLQTIIDLSQTLIEKETLFYGELTDINLFRKTNQLNEADDNGGK